MDSTGQKHIKRLFWDIETSPNVVLSWRIGFNLNLTPDNILKERAIICICWKWEGDSKVHSLTWDEFQSDHGMLKAFLEVAMQADELVAHNGDRFDMKWFRTRCLVQGFKALPQYKTVDTLQWAKRYFNFNSNKLDYIAKFLGVGAKLHTGYGLWKDIVLRKCPKALVKMVRYCKQDVVVLEKVWAQLRFIAGTKTHAGVVGGLDAWTCPHCASKDVAKSKTRVTAAGTKQHQMKCTCGAYYTINEAAFKKYNTHGTPAKQIS